MKKRVVCIVWIAFIFVGIFSLLKIDGKLNCTSINDSVKNPKIGCSGEIEPFIGVDNDRE